MEVIIRSVRILLKLNSTELLLGTCIRTNEEPYGGCSCPPEYAGPTCSNDPCSPSPCLNGGLCVRKPDNQFYCHCRGKHKGVYCERKFIFIAN